MACIDLASDARWYAVWTRSRHESVVREQLSRKAIEAFLPTVGRWRQWHDRRKKVQWPLFPGYCFARFNAANPLPVLKCAGVVRIVSFNGQPTPMTDVEVENLQRLVQHNLPYDSCPLLHEGSRVEVIGGPLRGVIGRLLRKEATRATLVLDVELIGQAVRVEVSARDVVLVDERPS